MALRACPRCWRRTAGYEVIEEVGVDTIRNWSVSLTEGLRSDMLERGFTVPSPEDPGQRGGTLTIGLAEDEDGPAFVAALADRKILVDHRPEAGIRVSPHFYTRREELKEFGEVMSELREAKHWPGALGDRERLLVSKPEASEVRYPGHGGDELRARLVVPPADVTEETPGRAGVVLIHEVFGLDQHMADIAARLAGAGYAVIAPDLYSRDGLPGPTPTDADPAPPWPADTIRAAVASLQDRRVFG